MILPAKIKGLRILARIPSISAKETAVMSIVWLPCVSDSLDISVSEPRFERELKQGKNREARLPTLDPISVAC